MQMKHTNAHKDLRVSYIIHILSFLHVHLPEEGHKCSRNMYTQQAWYKVLLNNHMHLIISSPHRINLIQRC